MLQKNQICQLPEENVLCPKIEILFNAILNKT